MTAPADTRTAAEARLGAHLLAAVRTADAAVPTGRRVPRTAAEMRARIAERGGRSQ